MRILFVISILLVFTACNQGASSSDRLQKQVDSLRQQLANTYRPGLGEFMSGIQMHHAKLWFAGQASNWKLADFEINEIKEAIKDIKKYNADRPEVASIGMITPAIDSITKAINTRSNEVFNRGFVLLTSTCNNCHTATKHEFNVIKIPAGTQFPNQEFDANKEGNL